MKGKKLTPQQRINDLCFRIRMAEAEIKFRNAEIARLEREIAVLGKAKPQEDRR